MTKIRRESGEDEQKDDCDSLLTASARFGAPGLLRQPGRPTGSRHNYIFAFARGDFSSMSREWASVFPTISAACLSDSFQEALPSTASRSSVLPSAEVNRVLPPLRL